MTDEELIDAFFSEPGTRKIIEEELGVFGKITVDWRTRIVTAKGTMGDKYWDIDELLAKLKKQLH